MRLVRHDGRERPVGWSAPRTPVLEHVVTGEAETFLWRCDDYPWERNVWNIHPEVEIHLIRNAAGVALVGDHIGAFEPGHLTVVGSGLPHDWVTPIQLGEVIHRRDVVVQVHPDRLRRAAEALPELAGVERFLKLASRGLTFHGETRRRGGEMMEAMGNLAGLERLGLFLQLLQLLMAGDEWQTLSTEHFAPATDRDSVDSIGEALTFVVENFRNDIRLGDLADRMGMSGWACSRFFKRNSGNSFTDYVARLRVGHACKLLAETELPVTGICFEVGYSNISNFNRTFRLQRGLTPSAYRRLARNRKLSSGVGQGLGA